MPSSDQAAQSLWKNIFMRWVAAMLALTAFVRAAFGQDSMGWDQCLGRDGSIPDVVIKGCSETIQDARSIPAMLAAAHNNRGVAYRLKRDYDLALNDYNEAIRLNPNNAAYYNNRGIIYRYKHDYDRAITDYGEAIWLKRDYVAAYYNRALAYTDKGAYEKATTDFAVVLQFNSKNALVLYARGMMFLKEGDAVSANADIEAARAINPNIAKEYDPSP